MKFKTLSIPLLILASSISLTACVTTSTQPGQGNFDVGKQNFINGDYFQAFKNLEPIAKAGNPEAQYAIGYMYFYGLGTAQDKAIAIQWMNAAAAQGNLHARQALQDIQQHAEFSSMQPFPGRLPSSSFVTQPRPGYNESPDQARDSSTEMPTDNSATSLQATWPPPSQGNVAPPPPPPSYEQPMTQGVDTAPITPEPVLQVPTTQEPVIPNPPPVAIQPMSLNTPAQGYTVQILASQDSSKIEEYIQSHHLEGQTKTYQTQRDGKNWYVLGYGNYATVQEAEEVIGSLTPELKKASPWVRDLAKLNNTHHFDNVG